MNRIAIAKELVKLARELTAAAKLRCVTPGVIGISMGEAHSAEVKKGDIFIIRRENSAHYFGDLDIRGSVFHHERGLGGHHTQLRPGHFGPSGMEFAVLKEHVGEIEPGVNPHGFFATWEEM